MTHVRSLVARLAGALVVAALLVGGCGKAGSPVAPKPVVPLSSLTLSPHDVTVAVAGSTQITSTALDTLGALVGDALITWTTSDAAIATVSSSGRVTGVGEGTTWVHAESGGRSDSSHVLVLGAGAWTVQPGNASGSNLSGVFFRPDGRQGWAVGGGGRIVHTTDAGASWNAQPSSTSFNLNRVWFNTDLAGLAVGSGGTVMMTTDGGAHWALNLNVGASENLLDVRFTSASEGWIVGTNGALLHSTDSGAHWSKTSLPTAFALRRIVFAGASEGWIVGDGGQVFGSHDGGDSWYPLNIGTSQPLHGASRLDAAHTLAVGQSGTVAVTSAGADSVVWSLPIPNAGASNSLEGCVLVNATTGFAVGYNAGVGGVVLRTTDGGTTWQSQASNTAVHLNDVFFVDALRGWAVGDGGIIIHTGNGGTP